MNLQRIKNYCKTHEGGVKQLADEIGMSESSLHRCIRTNKIQAGDLEKIAKALGVSILPFFDETATGNNEAVLQERINGLEKVLAEKERLINVLIEKK